jgi:hypothetical protein
MEEGKERFHRRCISRHEGEGKRAREEERRGMSLLQSFYLTFIRDESRQTRGTFSCNGLF